MDKCHARIVWKCGVLYAVFVKSAWKSSMASNTGTLQWGHDFHSETTNTEMLTLSVSQEPQAAQPKQ
jgi:hypothetical protein